MINQHGLKMVSLTFSVCCNALQLFPYTWNPVTYRLSRPTKLRLAVYNVHKYVERLLWLFSVSRFIMLCTWEDVPIRSYETHGVWVLAYSLGLVCFWQFDQKREEIMWFANCVFAYIEQNPVTQNRNVKGKPYWTWASVAVFTSGFLFFINPAAHALTIVDSPCVPVFTSSLFFPCTNTEENNQPVEAILPFWIFEHYITTILIGPWSFNWACIFLGLTWLKTELEKIRLSRLESDSSGKKRSELEPYRKVQFINVILGNAFGLYMEWFPSLLLGIVVLSVFASLRFTNVAFFSYIMAPACSCRCLFESMTALSSAGHVNSESIRTLAVWKRAERMSGGKEVGFGSFVKRFHKSCRIIFCAAGSLYTFESTIVLVNVNLSVQYVVNLLLMTKGLR